MRGSEGDRCISERLLHCWLIAAVLIVIVMDLEWLLSSYGCVNKKFPGSFYRLRRGVMVRMRRGESTLKVQWRDLVGIEGCLQLRLRILTSLDSLYMFGDVRVRLVYLAAPLSLC